MWPAPFPSGFRPRQQEQRSACTSCPHAALPQERRQREGQCLLAPPLTLGIHRIEACGEGREQPGAEARVGGEEARERYVGCAIVRPGLCPDGNLPGNLPGGLPHIQDLKFHEQAISNLI